MPTNLPSALDAERHLLGVLLRDQQALPDALTPSHFFEPKHVEIADAISSVCSNGDLPDELTVFQKLTEWRSSVPAFYLSDLTSSVGFSLLNKAWAEAIKRTYFLRQMTGALAKAKELAENPNSDAGLLNEYVRTTFEQIALENLPNEKADKSPQRMSLDALEAFDRKSDPSSVLGNRWLCKGGSLLIVGQSGQGKSSLMMQAAIRWCTGRDFFGINPQRPLRAVILQAENDLGDVAESYQDVKAGAMLHPPEERLLAENLAIFRDTISVGKTFAKVLKKLVTAQKADLIFCDPLLSFAGIDVSDQEQVTHFLRHDLAPILLETGCILIAMHHTKKPMSAADKEGQTVADMAYAGFGSSEFTNYFREVAVLVRMAGEQPIYKFGLTKRRGRSNMKNADGHFSPEILIRHAKEQGVIRWEYSTIDPSEQAEAQKTDGKPPRRRF